jgi:hypothetical protein
LGLPRSHRHVSPGKWGQGCRGEQFQHLGADTIQISVERVQPDDPALKDMMGPVEAMELLKEMDPGKDVLLKEKILITMTDQIDPGRWLIWREAGLSEPPSFVSFFPAVGTPYGFEFSLEQGSGSQRSTQNINQPFYDTTDHLLGYVEVSNGPAYGRQVSGVQPRARALASIYRPHKIT